MLSGVRACIVQEWDRSSTDCSHRDGGARRRTVVSDVTALQRIPHALDAIFQSSIRPGMDDLFGTERHKRVDLRRAPRGDQTHDQRDAGQ
jgi:hypothetical protein